jgi:hypothetical protein
VNDPALSVKLGLLILSLAEAAPITVRTATRVRVLIKFFIVWLLSFSFKNAGRHHSNICQRANSSHRPLEVNTKESVIAELGWG